MNDNYAKSLSTYEVANKLGISSQAVRELCKYGKIPGAYQTHKNGYWRIPINSLDSIDLKEIKNTLTWYDKAKYIIWGNKLRSLIILTAGVFTFFFAAISAGADIGGAREQLIEWGIVRTFPKAADGEILIVICRFNYSDNLVDTKIEEEIKRQIELTLSNFNLDNFRVEIDNRRIRADEFNDAHKFLLQHGATLLIWGEDTGIRVTVNMTSNLNPIEAKTLIDETNFTQVANPNQYQGFIISKLPAHITFISLFASGLVLERDMYYEPAISLIEKALAEVDIEEPIEGVINVYFTLGNLYQQDRTEFESLELIEPKPRSNTPPEFDKGIGYNTDLNANKKAIEYYDLVIALSPNGYTDYGTVYHNRGLARIVVGDLEGALNDFKIFFTKENPEKADITPIAYYYRGHGRLGLIKDYSGGIEDIYYAHKLEGSELGCIDSVFIASAYFGIDEDLGASGEIVDLSESFYLYDQIIKLNPSDCDKQDSYNLRGLKARAYFMKGFLNSGFGYHEKALEDFENMLEVFPEYEDKKLIERIIEGEKKAIENTQ